MAYDFDGIEQRWQSFWDEHKTFRADIVPGKPKYYVLDMFPYPSGSGLYHSVEASLRPKLARNSESAWVPGSPGFWESEEPPEPGISASG